MIRETLTTFAAPLLASLLLSCSAARTGGKNEAFITSPAGKIEAVTLPEVEVRTGAGGVYRGKILSLEGKNLEILPFPYWNVEPVRLDLGEVLSIKMLDERGSFGSGVAYGFAVPFIVVGTLGILTSKYDEDYRLSLLAAAAVGAAGGVVGLIIDVAVKAAAESEYDFRKMPEPEKRKTIEKIMGYA